MHRLKLGDASARRSAGLHRATHKAGSVARLRRLKRRCKEVGALRPMRRFWIDGGAQAVRSRTSGSTSENTLTQSLAVTISHSREVAPATASRPHSGDTLSNHPPRSTW